MKILLAAVVLLSLPAFAQKEVTPTYTTEPVTHQVAHCPYGYQLERWVDYSLHMADDAVYRPSGYYPVDDITFRDVEHLDKCVKLEPVSPTPSAFNGSTTIWSGSTVIEGTLIPALTTTGKLTYVGPQPEWFPSKGLIHIKSKDGTEYVIPVDEDTQLTFSADK